jgi:hypothetical protein
MVRYDEHDEHWRAHAHDREYNEVHVTEFGTFEGAKKLLREWAVANDVYYGGGYTRHDNPEQFKAFRESAR